MRRATRSVLAVLVAAAVTAGVSATGASVVLLAGVFVVYAAAVAITLRYPALLGSRDTSVRWSSGAFAGGATFGVLSLAQGLGVDFHVGAAALGFGLATFGLATGIWMADEHGESLDAH